MPVKNEEETCEKIIEMSNNNDYTTDKLLDFVYFKENYKLIATDLSKQTKWKDPQQINFIGKLDKNNGATMFFIIEKSVKMIKNSGSKYDDYSISPKIRQILLHWGYELTEKDFLMSW